LCKFARPRESKVQFSRVLRRTATSIVLLVVLIAGITPTGVCALMCERLARTESPRHCSQPSYSMSGMAHDHSAMNHPRVQAMSPVMVSHLCQTNCVAAERLNASRKIVPQVTVVESGAVVLDTAADFVRPDPATAWSSDSSPPYSTSVYSASFSILRI
jgi:hypothetical protein